MKTLLIASIYDYSGKTLVALGVGKRLQADGFKISYMKSLGKYPVMVNGIEVDNDVAFMYDILGLDDPPELLSPVMMTQSIITRAYRGEKLQLTEKIAQAHEELSKDKDVIIMGWAGTFNQGNLVGVPIRDLAERLNAYVVMLYKCEEEVIIDDLLPIKDMLGNIGIGVVFNQVELSRLEYTKDYVVPFITQSGMDVLGVLPKDPIITSVAIRELVEALGGEVLCCEHRLNTLVEQFSVGAMNIEGALKHFKKVKNKAVITGGDRTDIQLAALQTDTRCLILTGNLYPNEIVVARAQERDIPIILVQKDTLTIVQQVENIMSTLRIRDKRKIRRAIKLVDEEMDFPLLYERLQIQKPDDS